MCWRLVEAQHINSCRKITESTEDYDLLESELEKIKPPVSEEFQNKHFLFFTPTRYKPYPASRFRVSDSDHAVYYASEDVKTAVYECLFYKLKTFAASPDSGLPANWINKSAIKTPVKACRHLDLTKSPYVELSNQWTDRKDYSCCIGLADEAYKNDVELIRYQSVRDPEKGANLAIMRASAFLEREPNVAGSWKVLFNKTNISLVCENPVQRFDISLDAFDYDEDIRKFVRSLRGDVFGEVLREDA
ncbi:RES family NAD+ phosphorylase [Polycladidibacter hongkongensis]|uniref:RES family NAD+ phosphorylase n=1 Tax=Polycladidibacter hongkongensis TaxID=1647556 RepID=UPI00082B90C5|nr:RES family NAD+ phosphorylase [Pseudovibrio hongkongensis]